MEYVDADLEAESAIFVDVLREFWLKRNVRVRGTERLSNFETPTVRMLKGLFSSTTRSSAN